MQAWIVASGKDTKEGRQIVFLTALDPMDNDPDEEHQDMSKTRKYIIRRSLLDQFDKSTR